MAVPLFPSQQSASKLRHVGDHSAVRKQFLARSQQNYDVALKSVRQLSHVETVETKREFLKLTANMLRSKRILSVGMQGSGGNTVEMRSEAQTISALPGFYCCALSVHVEGNPPAYSARDI